MPQLDPSFFISELFWLFISFGLLYLFISKFVTPRMFMILDERESRISGTLRKSEKIRNEAVKFETEYNAKLSHAFKTASIRIAKASEEFKREIDEKRSNRDKESYVLLKDCEKRINEFRKKSEKELFNFSVEIIEEIVENVLGKHVKDKEAIKHMILAAKREVSLE
jgi:F-type H+-transporting ATPase subunit b